MPAPFGFEEELGLGLLLELPLELLLELLLGPLTLAAGPMAPPSTTRGDLLVVDLAAAL